MHAWVHVVELYACEPLFLGGKDDLAIPNERERAVVEEGTDAD